jgi:hypothetical protein
MVEGSIMITSGVLPEEGFVTRSFKWWVKSRSLPYETHLFRVVTHSTSSVFPLNSLSSRVITTISSSSELAPQPQPVTESRVPSPIRRACWSSTCRARLSSSWSVCDLDHKQITRYPSTIGDSWSRSWSDHDHDLITTSWSTTHKWTSLVIQFMIRSWTRDQTNLIT